MNRRGLSLPHYLVASGLAGAAAALNLALSGPLKGPTLLFPVTAVTLAGLYGGVRVGLLAAALSLAAHAFFVLQPRYTFLVAQRSDWYRLALLTVVASLMAAVAGSVRRAVRRAEIEKLERVRLFEAERAARLRAEAAEGEARRIGELQERLVAVVSHDLRSPLSAIAIGVDMLLGTGQLSEHQALRLTRIRNSAARMERLIRDLLDFTRARRAFEMPISPEPASMEEIARRAVLELRAANPSRDIRLDAQGDAGGRWDPARMEQVVSNLLSNAIQHGYSSSAVLARVRGNGPKVVLEVENQGRPLPAEKLPLLFEPFQGGEADQSGHLGLGLFIVREIVSAHGGTISASSTPAATTFRVELPRIQPPRGKAAAPETGPGSVTETPIFEPQDPRPASVGGSSGSAL